MTSNPLRHNGFIALPSHRGSGAFDHGAVHGMSGYVYVAHTANDAVDVFDPASRRHLFSVADLPGVAGVLVSDESQLIITSNRAENTIGIFAPGADPRVRKVGVGVGPNGLAYDPGRRLILVANVGDPVIAGSHTLTMVDVDAGAVRAEIPVAGRTRWAIYDPGAAAFYVNIMDPPQIARISAEEPDRVDRILNVPAAGPHGLDVDLRTHRLFCACDAGVLVTLDSRSGKVIGEHALSGEPDVIFFNRRNNHLYVAVGEPGVIQVFDMNRMQWLATLSTEKGTHTLALAPAGDQLYAFCPQTHRAAVYAVEDR